MVGIKDYIELIKIDIEGYEIELINHLIDTKALNNVGKIYLETHDKLYPQLEGPTDALKERIQKEGLADKFFYEWHWLDIVIVSLLVIHTLYDVLQLLMKLTFYVVWVVVF